VSNVEICVLLYANGIIKAGHGYNTWFVRQAAIEVLLGKGRAFGESNNRQVNFRWPRKT